MNIYFDFSAILKSLLIIPGFEVVCRIIIAERGKTFGAIWGYQATFWTEMRLRVAGNRNGFSNNAMIARWRVTLRKKQRVGSINALDVNYELPVPVSPFIALGESSRELDLT